MFQDDRLLPWETVLGSLLMTGNDPDKAKRLLARVGLEKNTLTPTRPPCPGGRDKELL